MTNLNYLRRVILGLILGIVPSAEIVPVAAGTTLLLLALPQSSHAYAASRPEKPDVLFIVIDDLNTDVATYGFAQVKSPGLDALARRGIVFDRAYCQYWQIWPVQQSRLS